MPLFWESELQWAILFLFLVLLLLLLFSSAKYFLAVGWEWFTVLIKEAEPGVSFAFQSSKSLLLPQTCWFDHICLVSTFMIHIINLMFSFIWLVYKHRCNKGCLLMHKYLLMMLIKLEPKDTKAWELVSVWKFYKAFRAESLSFLCARSIFIAFINLSTPAKSHPILLSQVHCSTTVPGQPGHNILYHQ